MKITHTAAVDTDFILHIAEINRPPERIAEILDLVLTALDVCAVIHPLVYAKELDCAKPAVSALFTAGVIRPLAFEPDIFQGDNAREVYYRYLVPELYRRLTGDNFPEGVDELTYWKRKSSLGEVHSVAMCLICGFGLFLSDDRDTMALKQIVEQQMLGQIEIYNRQEVLDRCSEDCDIPRADRRAFAHRANR
ncbi:MAG: hypothetical protein NC489_28160 [Ruminococcus flavefaciens]|nr:hypothetical protein [Ruminococcus flavefaciens]